MGRLTQVSTIRDKWKMLPFGWKVCPPMFYNLFTQTVNKKLLWGRKFTKRQKNCKKSFIDNFHPARLYASSAHSKIWAYHYDFYQIITANKASTTLSLDLRPPASPQFTGHWNWNALFPHGNHPKITSISHFSFFVFKCEMRTAAMLVPSKTGKN